MIKNNNIEFRCKSLRIIELIILVNSIAKELSRRFKLINETFTSRHEGSCVKDSREMCCFRLSYFGWF
jgi:hypothetical protein